MRKLSILIVLALFLSLSGTALSEDIELRHGETKNLEGYTLSYENLGTTPYFEVKKDVGDSDSVLEQIKYGDLLDMEGQRLEISDELDVVINEVGTDSEGLYLKLGLESPQDIFARTDLDSSAPRKVFVEQGGEVTVPLELENTGIVNQTYSLDASHNSSMDVSFSYRDFNITNLKVNTGEKVSISAKFDVPETAEPGVYDVEMYASGRSNASESITVEVRESQSRKNRKEISVDADQSYIGIKPGESKEISVRVRNQGGAMLDNVEVSVNAPSGWSTEISRKSIPGLERYESFRTIITVEAPVNAKTGDKFLEVSASSDETSTDEPQRIRMTVQEESNLRYIGLGIMVLSLSGLIYVYRKLGRR